MKRPLIWIGPWADDQHPNRPRPQDHIDESWDERERTHVEFHLTQGLIVGAPLDGFLPCSLCGVRVTRGFIQTDGSYLWRRELVHYVAEHAVRPPARFVDHVMRIRDLMDQLETDDLAWWDGDPYSPR